MDVTRIIWQLRSEQKRIEQAILLIGRSDRKPVGAAIGRQHTRMISRLRSEREDIAHAIVSLEEYCRLTRHDSDSTKVIEQIYVWVSCGLEKPVEGNVGR